MSEGVERIIKTSINIPAKLWRDVKVYAAKEGLKLTEVVQAALKRYLELSEEEAKAEKQKSGAV
jgi:metal-responsive CopG/Arc/MetJ family transcriptional regulator